MESYNASISESSSHDAKRAVFLSMVIRAVFVVLLALTGIVGNIINIVVIPRVPDTSMGAASKVVLTALAITDLIGAVMLLNGPLSIFTYQWLSSRGNIYCDITGFITTLAPATSASFIFLINLDRYVQITRPLSYHVLVTKKKAIVAVITASFYIFVFLSLFVGIADNSVDPIAYQYGFSVCLVSFSAPIFLMSTIGSFTVSVWLVAVLLLLMYARIFQIALHHSKKISAQRYSTARLRDVVTDSSHHAFQEGDLGVTSVVTHSSHDGSDEGDQGVAIVVTHSSHDASEDDDLGITSVMQGNRDASENDDNPGITSFTTHSSQDTSEDDDHEIVSVRDVIVHVDANVLNSTAQRKRDWVRRAKRDHDVIQRNIRSLRIPLIITGCFLVSWLPLTVMFTFASATGATFGNITWWITAVMAGSNCTNNMFVYAFGRSEFRRTIRKIFCRTC